MKADLKKPEDCLELGPFNTILVYAPHIWTTSNDQTISLSVTSTQYDHLIVLNDVQILDRCDNKDRIGKRTSLTVYKNTHILSWDWLECTRFKYVHIDDCYASPYQSMNFDQAILSEHLLTLNLVQIIGINPLQDINYALAPNLRELSINYCSVIGTPPSTVTDGKLKKLRRLNLENNKISYLPQDFFHSMPSLEVVILENNQFKAFPYTFASPLKRVLLDGKLTIFEFCFESQKCFILFLTGNDLEGDKETCEFLRSPFALFTNTN